ncbi:MAG: hypothetical protein MJD61_05905, partial [Proteobacteria bacterium]|nr:hypothetical protein [Pseudomonadota bacterium]
MTQPRQYLPGSTYMLTRRVIGRHYLLRPDELVGQIYLYCLATMSEKHGIVCHGFTLMSSHSHLTVTDTRGELGAFLRDFHRLVANAMKLVRDWDGILWDGSEPSVVRLETPHAFLQQAAYVIANPVSAGAVPRSKQWPGLRRRVKITSPLRFRSIPSSGVAPPSNTGSIRATARLAGRAPQNRPGN